MIQSKLVLYKGARGRGKTLTMVKDGLAYHNQGFKVYANFKCTFAEYITGDDIRNLDKSSDMKLCILMIDEIQIYFDSRQGMKKENKAFSNFVQQIRKRGIILLCTTQYSNTMDKRIRQHLDIIAFPLFDITKLICEVTYVDFTRLDDSVIQTDFKPSMIKIVFNARNIFNLYDTNELII